MNTTSITITCERLMAYMNAYRRITSECIHWTLNKVKVVKHWISSLLWIPNSTFLTVAKKNKTHFSMSISFIKAILKHPFTFEFYL